jgi:hypothetical protein
MKHKIPPRIELPPTPRTNAAFDLMHTKHCSIKWFREVMESLERDLIAAKQALDDASKPTVAKAPKVVVEPDDK